MCRIKSGVADRIFSPTKSLKKYTKTRKWSSDWRLVLWLIKFHLFDAPLSKRWSQKSSVIINYIKVGNENAHKHNTKSAKNMQWTSVFETKSITFWLFNGTCVNKRNMYCETLTKLWHAIQDQLRSKLSSVVILLHNARPLTAALRYKIKVGIFLTTHRIGPDNGLKTTWNSILPLSTYVASRKLLKTAGRLCGKVQ